MSLVRLYGSFVGHGSSSTVTDGWLEALQQHGLLAGCCSARGSDQRELGWGGEQAPVAVVADLKELIAALSVPAHKEIHVVVAMHSDWLPDVLKFNLRDDDRVSVLATSQDTCWKFEHLNLRRAGDKPVPCRVVAHAAAEGFQPLTEQDREALKRAPLWGQMRSMGLNWLHMCESSTERKGTYVLLRAFSEYTQVFMQRNLSPASLTVVSSSYQLPALKVYVGQLPGAGSIRVLPRLNAAPAKLRWLYGCFDAIVQPSRAEGFGLVPWEGLTVGVPCAITTECGHAQWAFPSEGDRKMRPGIVSINTGEYGPPLFEPEPSPTLRESDVLHALTKLSANWKELRESAQENAPNLRKITWKTVTEAWAGDVRRRYA